jgi:curli biogenesis system outer membrane secretion channel CsgG
LPASAQLALALATLLAGPPEAPTPLAPPARPAVVVLDFDGGTLAAKRAVQYDIGRGVATRLVEALVEDGRLRVIERSLIFAVLGEQDFAASDRAHPDAARLARVGRLGVRYVVAGSIHLAPNDRKGGKAGKGGPVTLTARFIDTTTGEVAGWAQAAASVRPEPELTNLGKALESSVVALARRLLAQAGELSTEAPMPEPTPTPEPPPTPPAP